jgi:tetratricopeptide (TPR) repeat protein
MTYLTQDEAAEVMTFLPVDLQAKVAIAMAQVKQASAESVMKASEDIEKKIDFLVGGTEKFLGILDRMDRTTRDEILEALEKENSILAAKIRKEIFSFENIVELDDVALQLALREMKTEGLAKALIKAPENILEKVKKNISSGANTLLEEEMNLAGYVTPMQIEEERTKIVKIVKKLETEGKIQIGKKLVRKKIEKIGKLQKIKARVEEDDEDDSDLAVSENAVSGEASKERKVSISDYQDGADDKIISMANIFKQISGRKEALLGQAKETNDSKPAGSEKEMLYVSQKEGSETSAVKPDPSRNYSDGVKFFNEKKYDDAVRELETVIEINPNIWQVYQLLGNCYYAKGNIVKTVEAYRKSLNLNPNNPALAGWMKNYDDKSKSAAQ